MLTINITILPYKLTNFMSEKMFVCFFKIITADCSYLFITKKKKTKFINLCWLFINDTLNIFVDAHTTSQFNRHLSAASGEKCLKDMDTGEVLFVTSCPTL